MLDHLDDPVPFDIDDRFHARVLARARVLRSRRRRVTAATSTALAAVSVATIVAVRPAGTDSSPVTVSDSTNPAETTIDSTSTAPSTGAIAMNVLIVGIDQTTEGGPRTDTIVVARIDPTNQTLTLLPIPRDLWVRVGDHNQRINTAFAAGEAAGLVNAVTATFGIPIHHYIQVDFAGFRQIVDAVGGLELSFAQPIRDANTGLALGAGCDHLDGATALAYVRSREIEQLDRATNTWMKDPTADLGRIRRAQALLVGLLQHLRADPPDPLSFPRILDAVTPNLVVDKGLSDGHLLALARAVLKTQTAVSLQPTVDGEVINGSAILILRDDDHNAAISRLFNGETETVPPESDGVGAAPAQEVDGVVCS